MCPHVNSFESTWVHDGSMASPPWTRGLAIIGRVKIITEKNKKMPPKPSAKGCKRTKMDVTDSENESSQKKGKAATTATDDGQILRFGFRWLLDTSGFEQMELDADFMCPEFATVSRDMTLRWLVKVKPRGTIVKHADRMEPIDTHIGYFLKYAHGPWKSMRTAVEQIAVQHARNNKLVYPAAKAGTSLVLHESVGTQKRVALT